MFANNRPNINIFYFHLIFLLRVSFFKFHMNEDFNACFFYHWNILYITHNAFFLEQKFNP